MAFGLILGGLALMKLLSFGGKTWLAPWNGYIFAQVVLLGVAYLKLSPEMIDFSLITWLAVVMSGVAFLGGCALASVLYRENRWKIRSSKEFESFFFALLHGALPILLVLFFVGVYLSYRTAGGWPVLMRHPDSARTRFAWPGYFGEWLFQLNYCVSLSGMVLLRYERQVAWKALAWLGLLTPIGVALLSGMRFYAIVVILTWIFFRNVFKPIPFGRLLAVSALLLGGLTTAFLMRMSLFNLGLLHTGLPFKELSRMLYLPIYEYIANNFWNLDWMFRLHELTRSVPTSYGYSSFWGFFFAIGLATPINQALNLNSQLGSILKVHSLNTTAFQGVIFMDFGWLGLIAIPALLGFSSTWAFHRAKQTHSSFDVIIYAILTFSVFFSFFAWSWQLPCYFLALLMIVSLGSIAKAMLLGNLSRDSSQELPAN